MSSADLLKNTLATEFAGESDEKVNTFIGLAAKACSRKAWGKRYAEGVVFLAAHMLKLEQRAKQQAAAGGAGAGGISSISTGDVSFSYESVPARTVEEAVLLSTSYGAQHLAMRQSLIGTPYVIGSGLEL